jgi:hypothetical protein
MNQQTNTIPPQRVTIPSAMHTDSHPTFEQWPVSETYRRSAEALITASVSFLDALGKQGNVEEVRQLIKSTRQQDSDLQDGPVQTIEDAFLYLQWFEMKCEKEYASPINRLRSAA